MDNIIKKNLVVNDKNINMNNHDNEKLIKVSNKNINDHDNEKLIKVSDKLDNVPQDDEINVTVDDKYCLLIINNY